MGYMRFLAIKLPSSRTSNKLFCFALFLDQYDVCYITARYRLTTGRYWAKEQGRETTEIGRVDQCGFSFRSLLVLYFVPFLSEEDIRARGFLASLSLPGALHYLDYLDSKLGLGSQSLFRNKTAKSTILDNKRQSHLRCAWLTGVKEY